MHNIKLLMTYKTKASLLWLLKESFFRWLTQVNDSDFRKRADSDGKRRTSHRILQENSGNRWNMEAVFRSGIFLIFPGGFPAVSCGKAQENVRNSPTNIRRLSGQNTAIMFRVHAGNELQNNSKFLYFYILYIVYIWSIRVYQGLSGSTRVYQGLSGSTRVYQGLSGSTRISQDF